MLAEFVDRIRGLAKAADATQVLEVSKLPRKVFVRQGDRLDIHDVPAPDRAPVLEGFDDLVQMLGTQPIAPRPEVYVGADEVVAFLDATARTERLKLSLPKTDRALTLCALVREPVLTVKDAIRLLRLELYGDHAPQLIGALRTVDFSRTSAGRMHTEHGRESLGRSTEAKVQGVEQIPEEFRVRVPLFQVAGLRDITIEVGVRIVLAVENERIEFHPTKDELRAATAAALREVRDRIQKAFPLVAVFQGSP